MKTGKVLCMILALVMVFTIAACGNNAKDKKDDTAPAAEDLVLKNEDLQLTVPAEYADLVIDTAGRTLEESVSEFTEVLKQNIE